MNQLTTEKILMLFNALDKELESQQIKGELYLVGGAVMCVALEAQEPTLDVDGLFKPSKIIREAAAKIAKSNDLSPNWLNDGVKDFFSSNSQFNLFLQLKHLNIYCAIPEYLLAMKCLAMRIGEEFHDLDDVRYLVRYLNLSTIDEVSEIISEYYPLEQYPTKTLYVLNEIMQN